ncbi:MAG: hypothetical protein ACFFDB_14205 [Promethearchaeota archaeon]
MTINNEYPKRIYAINRKMLIILRCDNIRARVNNAKTGIGKYIKNKLIINKSDEM